jgi:tRNA(fMet)-specific endonuclease VapC
MRGTASVVGVLAAHVPGDIAVSSVTCYELYTGVEKCADPQRERTKVDALVGTVSEVAFDRMAAMESASIRARLESRGEMIGPYDVLIAGQAVSLGLTLVTNNTDEFARVEGLRLEDWQSPVP